MTDLVCIIESVPIKLVKFDKLQKKIIDSGRYLMLCFAPHSCDAEKEKRMQYLKNHARVSYDSFMLL